MNNDVQSMLLECKKRIERQEEIIEQLITIVAATNQKCNELQNLQQAIAEFIREPQEKPLKDLTLPKRKTAMIR